MGMPSQTVSPPGHQLASHHPQPPHLGGMTSTSSSPVTGCPTLDPFQDTDRRSSSIAALRLKAREHSAAMGIHMGLLSAYGK